MSGSHMSFLFVKNPATKITLLQNKKLSSFHFVFIEQIFIQFV